HSTVPRRSKSNASLHRCFGRGRTSTEQLRHTREKIRILQHIEDPAAAVLAAVALRPFRNLRRRHGTLLILIPEDGVMMAAGCRDPNLGMIAICRRAAFQAEFLAGPLPAGRDLHR